MDNNIITFVKVENDAGVKNISALAETIWFEYFPSIISVQQIEYMLDKFLSEKAITEQMARGTEYYIVKKDREFIGFVAMNVEVSGNKRKLFLSKFYLEKIHRGNGYATSMFEFVKRQAADKKCECIFLTVNKYNSRAIDVYYHWGFRKLDDLVMDIGKGYVMDDYLMAVNV